ncbi:protease modulator HflC [Parvularcula maris]|uniref:Protein HflC n=1 Tax=Parvularcula maris TaxID=2965077 RepID=A0A9X2L7U7_9PROT|nr:protease modulator HflC [Parvularcula maris]MCQ8184685.1 protease modulator HflC [Parvularcula maris]
MKNLSYAVLAFVIVGLIIASSALFTVKEDEQAIVLQFGDPVKTIPSEDAGLHFKTPVVQNVVRFSAKNLNFDAAPVEVIVANEERLLVDAFVRYEIADPLLYFQRLSGVSTNALEIRERFDTRIGAVLGEAVRQVLGEVQIRDIITERRGELMAAIQAAVSEEARALGVRIIDVRIRQADFPQENAENVYERMISDYNQQAESIRAEGERQAREITASAEKEVVQITAAAREESQRIRGAADGQRNAIYNQAYTRDPEFFAFYRSLTAYEQALQDGQTTIILSPDSEFFRYFNDQEGR